MAESDATWSANSSDAINISLVTASDAGLKSIASFHPAFTYPIFGEEESIFGYQGLQINIRFHANDMRPGLRVLYDRKFKTVGDTEPADIDVSLREFLPEVAFCKESEYLAAVKQVDDAWTPPGAPLPQSFADKDGTYEIWTGSLTDPAVKQMIKRIQILVSFFIEGGTYIDEDGPDCDRWTVFFLYHKRPVPQAPGKFSYVFAGYSTVYRFMLFQVPTPPTSPGRKKEPAGQSGIEDLDLSAVRFSLDELPCRTRISQFVVIPPFQGRGIGPKFYNVLFEHYLKHPQTKEITVEDPNEAFDDLRDIADLTYLQKIPDFNNLGINKDIAVSKAGPAPRNIVDEAKAESIRRKYKIAPRQFGRVVEMHLMSQLPNSVRPELHTDESKPAPSKADEHLYRLWKLLVKQRLYRHNKQTLGQLERNERIDKLEETTRNVELGYARLVGKQARQAPTETLAISNGKRKLQVDETEPSSSKKIRIEDA